MGEQVAAPNLDNPYSSHGGINYALEGLHSNAEQQQKQIKRYEK